MKGYHRFDEKASRWYVGLYWEGSPRRIYRYNGEPIWHEKTAIKLLNKIRENGLYGMAEKGTIWQRKNFGTTN